MKVFAIMRNEASGVQLDAECTEMNGTRVEAHIGRLKDVKPDVEILRSLDVLLLDVNPKDAGEIALLDDIVNKHFPNVPVIGTAADATVQDVRQLMRLGVVDFVPQPFTRADILAAINLAASRRSNTGDGDASKGAVFSFIKGGGGVGATTLAVQAGCLLAGVDKNTTRKIGLFDLDLQLGTAALYLDLDNRVGLSDLLDSPERLDASLLEAVVQTHESGLQVVGAPRKVIPLDALNTDFVNMVGGLGRDEYDVLLLDLPPVWTEGMYTALRRSDVIFLVTQLSVAGIRQAKHQLDTLRLQGLVEADVRVVLNRYEKGWGKAVQLKEAEKALGHQIDYLVPNDYKLVSEALDQGVALSHLKSRSRVEKAIREMMLEALGTVEARSAGAQKIAAVPGLA